jgi:hypothetical protein
LRHIKKMENQNKNIKKQINLIAISLAAFTLFISPYNAMASSKPKAPEGGAMANPLTVEIPGIVVPIAKGKRLVNYCFMVIVIHSADDRSATILRANQFVVKDAITRATNKNPIQVLPQAASFNVNEFRQRVIPAITAAFNGVRINNIEVLTPQMRNR